MDPAAVVSRLRATFDSGRTRPLAWRKKQLKNLERMILEREDEILDALHLDVGKPRLEAWLAEISHCKTEIELTLDKLDKWAAPEKVSTPVVLQPAKSWIHKEPLGVVLIISPWNYPFSLAISPLIGAIAAGNCALVKPSEVSPHTSAAIARLLPQYLDEDAVQVIEGGVPETTAILDQRFDHIFYTGSTSVGRVIMTAAAQHLTPVTLELGGKSPCIVDRNTDLDTVAKRLTWGKFYNAGQTCLAPDYVLVHEQVKKPLLDKVRDTVKSFYGDDPKTSPDYARIVNRRHHQRLSKLLGEGKPATRVDLDEADRYISPVVLDEVSPSAPVMQEEIFGPILPVLTFGNTDEAVRFVNERPKPLALYVFSQDDTFQQDIVERTSSGGAVINHVWLHFGVPTLPFGGVGESGMGAYHGRASFDTFTHRRSVLQKSLSMEPPLLYPPYDGLKSKIVKILV
jgi:aldehyde dehydrogenase (NAD+)